MSEVRWCASSISRTRATSIFSTAYSRCRLARDAVRQIFSDTVVDGTSRSIHELSDFLAVLFMHLSVEVVRMFGRTRQFWVGVVFLLVGTVLLFGNSIPGINGSLILIAVGVLVLAAGTLLIAVERGQRPV